MLSAFAFLGVLGILTSVRPQMVGFGSEQGLSNFETGGVAGYVEDFKRAKTPLWAKRCRLWMGTNYKPISSLPLSTALAALEA
jgi:hypothetical protein